MSSTCNLKLHRSRLVGGEDPRNREQLQRRGSSSVWAREKTELSSHVMSLLWWWSSGAAADRNKEGGGWNDTATTHIDINNCSKKNGDTDDGEMRNWWGYWQWWKQSRGNKEEKSSNGVKPMMKVEMAIKTEDEGKRWGKKMVACWWWWGARVMVVAVDFRDQRKMKINTVHRGEGEESHAGRKKENEKNLWSWLPFNNQ